MIESIHQWQEALTSAELEIRACPVTDHTHILSDAEKVVIAKAVDIRCNTYSSGRQCARQALHALGIASSAYSNGLLRMDDGAVQWPQRCIGSISHTNEWALAVVGMQGKPFASVGIDIENIERVGDSVLHLIASENEQAMLQSLPELHWGRAGIFSIKESVYKCLRPIYGDFFGFKDVELSDLDAVASAISTPSVAIFTPSIKLQLPGLVTCCDVDNIDIRIAVLDELVVSFVSYRES